MSRRVKGLLISPFILFIIASCVSTPEKPEKPPAGNRETSAVVERPEEDPIAFYRGPEDAAEAIRVMEEMEDEKMDRDSRFIYYSLLISNNDLDKAAEQLDILLRENPDDREILAAYITLSDYLGDKAKRDEALDHLISLDPESGFVINMKGTFALREEKYSEAEKLFRKSISYDRDNPESYIGLANALMHIDGREKESLESFNLAEEIDSENPFIYSDRSRVYRFLKDYGKAEDDLTRAIELYPSEWNYLDRARIRIGDLNERERAKEDLLAVMDQNPENFFANVYLAGLYDEEGEYDLSLVHYEKVLELASDYNYAYPALGKLYYIKERWAESAQMYRKAVETGLNDLTYPLMGWLALYRDGREKEGQQFLNSYIGKLDRSSAVYEMYRYYLSPSSPYFVQMAIDKEKDETLRDRMKFYMAMIDALKGREGTAQAILGEIAARKGAPEFELANLYLEKK
ncbi:MAG: tetratricopeptide repeat protein [Spirochaetales bacterium]|nr:tetratricopeptide repeat protein [Spirochaetales bacterium]